MDRIAFRTEIGSLGASLRHKTQGIRHGTVFAERFP